MGLTSGSARGDIPPIVTGEYVFVILMEVVGTVALGLILGSLSSMFMVRVHCFFVARVVARAQPR